MFMISVRTLSSASTSAKRARAAAHAHTGAGELNFGIVANGQTRREPGARARLKRAIGLVR